VQLSPRYPCSATAILSKIIDRSFRYASPGLWNKLPLSFRQSHSGTSSSISDSPIPSPVTSSLCDSEPHVHYSLSTLHTAKLWLYSRVLTVKLAQCQYLPVVVMEQPTAQFTHKQEATFKPQNLDDFLQPAAEVTKLNRRIWQHFFAENCSIYIRLEMIFKRGDLIYTCAFSWALPVDLGGQCHFLYLWTAIADLWWV